jgi:hypothetical protein
MSTSGAPYPSGKGAVCKTAMQRFEPARRLQTKLACAAAFDLKSRRLSIFPPVGSNSSFV